MTNKTELLPCPFCNQQAVATDEMFGSIIHCDHLHICPLDGHEQLAAGAHEWNTRAAPSEDVRAVVDERTPKDYAIEHAEYLATAADGVQEAYKAYSLAQMNIDEGGDDGEGELAELVDGARQDLHEALQNLRGMAYEFRKRSARATKP